MQLEYADKYQESVALLNRWYHRKGHGSRDSYFIPIKGGLHKMYVDVCEGEYEYRRNPYKRTYTIFTKHKYTRT